MILYGGTGNKFCLTAFACYKGRNNLIGSNRRRCNKTYSLYLRSTKIGNPSSPSSPCFRLPFPCSPTPLLPYFLALTASHDDIPSLSPSPSQPTSLHHTHNRPIHNTYAHTSLLLLSTKPTQTPARISTTDSHSSVPLSLPTPRDLLRHIPQGSIGTEERTEHSHQGVAITLGTRHPQHQ